MLVATITFILMKTINSNAASAEEPTVATAGAKLYSAKKGLRKNNKPRSRTPSSIKNFFVKSENNKQTSVPAAKLQRDAEPEDLFVAEESREANDDASNTKSTTSEEVQNANAILASAIKISEEGEEHPVTEVVVEQRDGAENVPEDCSIALPDDACWTAVNERTSNAWATVNDESAKAWENVESSKAYMYNEMSNHLTKVNESASHVYNKTVDGFTTAYVMAEEDLSIMGLAITQTNTMKSLNELQTNTMNTMKSLNELQTNTMKSLNELLTTVTTATDEDEDECEGEGMEVSLKDNIRDTKTLSEI